MHFTYKSYIDLINLIREGGYQIVPYEQCDIAEYETIIRHDIDFSIDKAYELAIIENDIGINANYFFLISSDFYNAFSYKSVEIINKIAAMGHGIGLHFDEKKYNVKDDVSDIIECIEHEINIFSEMIGIQIDKVSMHRPSRHMLESEIVIPGIINTYSNFFFKEFKYLSDSRREWREPVEKYISKHMYDKFQVLIHPFWYNEKEETIEESIKRFVNSANLERYNCLMDNLKDLDSVMSDEDIK